MLYTFSRLSLRGLVSLLEPDLDTARDHDAPGADQAWRLAERERVRLQVRRAVAAGRRRLARRGILPFASFPDGKLAAEWPHDGRLACDMTDWRRDASRAAYLHAWVGGDPLPEGPPTLGDVRAAELQWLLSCLGTPDAVGLSAEIATAAARCSRRLSAEIAVAATSPWQPPGRAPRSASSPA